MQCGACSKTGARHACRNACGGEVRYCDASCEERAWSSIHQHTCGVRVDEPSALADAIDADFDAIFPLMDEPLKKDPMNERVTVGHIRAVVQAVARDMESRYAKATRNKELVDGLWVKTLAMRGVSDAVILQIMALFERAEQTFAGSVPDSLIGDYGDAPLEVSNTMYAVEVLLRAAVQNNPVQDTIGEQRARRNRLIGHSMAKKMIRIARIYSRKVFNEETAYVKDDAQTRYYGLEPDARWEGTNAEIAAKIARGELPEQTEFNERLSAINKRGSFMGDPVYGDAKSAQKRTPQPVGVRTGFWGDKGKEEEESESDYEDDDESYIDADVDAQARQERLDRAAWEADPISDPQTPVLDQHGNARFWAAVRPHEISLPDDAAGIRSASFNADWRVRNFGAVDDLFQLQVEATLSAEYDNDENAHEVKGGCMAYLLRWTSPQNLGYYPGCVVGLAAASYLLWYAYQYELLKYDEGAAIVDALEKMPAQFNEVVHNFNNAAQDMATHTTAIYEKLNEIRTAAHGNATISEFRTSAMEQFLRLIASSPNGMPSLRLVHSWLTSTVETLRETGRTGTYFSAFMAPYEAVLEVLNNPSSPAEAVQAATEEMMDFMKTIGLGNVVNLPRHMQQIIAQQAVYFKHVIEEILPQMIKSAGILCELALKFKDLSPFFAELIKKMEAILATGRIQAGVSLTSAGELVQARITGAIERSTGRAMGYIGESIVGYALSPYTAWSASLHSWIRSEDGMRVSKMVGSEFAAATILSAPNMLVFTGVTVLFNNWKLALLANALKWILYIPRRVFGMDEKAKRIRERYKRLSAPTRGGFVSGDDFLRNFREGRIAVDDVPETMALSRSEAAWAYADGLLVGFGSHITLASEYPMWTGYGLVTVGLLWQYNFLRGALLNLVRGTPDATVDFLRAMLPRGDILIYGDYTAALIPIVVPLGYASYTVSARYLRGETVALVRRNRAVSTLARISLMAVKIAPLGWAVTRGVYAHWDGIVDIVAPIASRLGGLLSTIPGYFMGATLSSSSPLCIACLYAEATHTYEGVPQVRVCISCAHRMPRRLEKALNPYIKGN